MKKAIYGIMITGLLLVLGCDRPALPPEDKDFRADCRQAGFEWMAMRPMEQGVFTAEEACLGCMAGFDHICDKEKFKAMMDSKFSLLPAKNTR
ncbi:hypothetical protein HYU13_02530 [Candidatus Woesearchaeota archaeon]|nr:hypothetical protein [Candidatus Woesearchaeota archaeon]